MRRVRRIEIEVVKGRGRAERVLARGAASVPYLLAQVVAVHAHDCAATRWGKKEGPCNCGGQALYDEWERKR